MVQSLVVPKGSIKWAWPRLEKGLEIYREKSPHPIPDDEELQAFLESPEGDELFMFGQDEKLVGFVTFKVQDLPGVERWGTISILWVDEEFQRGSAMTEAMEQLEEILRNRGCAVMNYMTARKGFKRLAPRLGFKPRITEWMKEL